MSDERCRNCEHYNIKTHICSLKNKAMFKTSYCEDYHRRGVK